MDHKIDKWRDFQIERMLRPQISGLGSNYFVLL